MAGSQRAEGAGSVGLRQNRREIVTWVGSNIVPHEADPARPPRHEWPSLKKRSATSCVTAYLKISKLVSVAHIMNGRGYFFATARTMLLDRIRREADRADRQHDRDEALTLADEDPGPERRVSARLELRAGVRRRLSMDCPGTLSRNFRTSTYRGAAAARHRCAAQSPSTPRRSAGQPRPEAHPEGMAGDGEPDRPASKREAMVTDSASDTEDAAVRWAIRLTARR